MSIVLALLIVVISFGLSAFFVMRDAKRFAIAPPTPLIDLDRLYDTIFVQLDEFSGSAMTPQELVIIIDSFVSALGGHGLIKENLAEVIESSTPETIDNALIVEEIFAKNEKLDVPKEVVANVVDLSFVYLREINAVI